MKHKTVTGTMLILLLANMLGLWMQPIAAQPSGMVSYWRLNDGSGTTAYDSVGDNNGTLINGPTWTTGQVDGALSFDGADDYVDCGTGIFLGANDFSVEAWVYFNGGGDTWIFEHAAGGEVRLDLKVDGSERLQVRVNDGSPPDYAITDSVSLAKGSWIHVAGVRDGNTFRAYKNGIEFGNATGAEGAIDSLGTPTYIGRSIAMDMGTWNGSIDEVAIYNRTLTPAEIQLHYHNGLRGMSCLVNLGDVNGDGIVDIVDGVAIGVAFDSSPQDSNWNPLADIAPLGAPDNIINIQDIVLWAIHFGETA